MHVKDERTANFSVSRVFSDNMVLQRDELVRIWGFAPNEDDGKEVFGEFKGVKAKAIIKNGEWCITFPETFCADTSANCMKIYSGEKEIVFKDVLVGDVLMVIGQSNVEAEMSVHFSLTDPAVCGGGEEAVNPQEPIRLNRTTAKESLDEIFGVKGTRNVCRDCLNNTQWTKTTLEETLKFSALGYYFAKEMVKRSDEKIPYGIIEVGFSGMPLGAFLPNEVADKLKTDTYDEKKGIYTTTGRNAKEGSGRYIYNRHIYPFEKYSIAGLVWYQGESNGDITEAPYYNDRFSALVEHMRSTHNIINRNFPVFVVELPSIYPKPEGYTGTDALRWRYIEIGMVRSYIGTIPLQIENSYVAACGDLWGNKEYCNGLHPYIKYEQAQRIADIAQVILLKKGTLDEATGPIFEALNVSDDLKKAKITFKNVGEGLSTSDGGNKVRGIVGLIRKDNTLQAITPQDSCITDKNEITVLFDEMVDGVAYNFKDSDYYSETINLCNSFGKIATGFCKVGN